MKIGQGGYGKVYRPLPINCDNLSGDMNDYVGKFVKSTESKVITLQKKRIKIDPKNIFTIPLIGICKKNLKNKNFLLWQGTKYNLELIYTYGGKSLTELKLMTDSERWKFFCSFYSFCEFIFIMNKLGYYHLDIKEDNILFINSIYKLIDFDLCLSKDEIYNIFVTKKDFENILYTYWSPEINFLMNSSLDIKEMFKIPDQLKSLLEYFKEKELLKRLNRFFESKDYMEGRNNPYSVDYTKSDLYSVGLILKNKLYSFNRDIDKLIEMAVEFIPSKRCNWPTFLAFYKKILIKNFTSSNI